MFAITPALALTRPAGLHEPAGWGRWPAALERVVAMVEARRPPRGSSAGTWETPSPAAGPAAADARDIGATLGGDGEAYRRLVERYQGAIAQQMRRFSRDPATCEQLVHDAFVEAYLSLAKYRGRAPWLHWLRRIATRVGYRYWKQQGRQESEVSLSVEQWSCLRGQSPPPHDPLEAAELVQTLLGRLPPRDRLVLTLIYLEDCSTREAAARTGWTVPLVKVQAYRARRKLARLLETDAP